MFTSLRIKPGRPVIGHQFVFESQFRAYVGKYLQKCITAQDYVFLFTFKNEITFKFNRKFIYITNFLLAEVLTATITSFTLKN